MSLSVGRVGRVGSWSVSAASSRSFAYQVASTSVVSGAYTQRIQGIDAARQVDPADPLRYATAARRQVAASKEAEMGFYGIAESFELGGYSGGGDAYTYSLVGMNYDEFA